MSKKLTRTAQPYAPAEQAWKGYTRTIPGGTLTKQDFLDAFFAGKGSPKWNQVDAVVRSEAGQARGGAYQQSVIHGPQSVTRSPDETKFDLAPSQPTTPKAPAKPIPVQRGPYKQEGAVVLQTALNALSAFAKALPAGINESFADAPKAKAALSGIVAPIKNYGFNSAPVSVTGKLDAETQRQYELAVRLKNELSQMNPLAIWGDAARENIKALGGNMAGVKALKDSANEIMNEVTNATAAVAGTALNRAANSMQSALTQFIDLPSVELEEEEEKPAVEKRELTEAEERWARHFARERVNAAVTRRNRDMAPADAAQLMMSEKIRNAIAKEYGRVADILRDPARRGRLVGVTTDTPEGRKAKMDLYKQTGKLAARIDYESVVKFANKYYALIGE